MLKLKISGGSATATTIVDPAEEAQVRVLAPFARTHLVLRLLTLAAHLSSCAPRLSLGPHTQTNTNHRELACFVLIRTYYVRTYTYTV